MAPIDLSPEHSTLNRVREMAQRASAADPAHDWSHCERVLANALRIAREEGGDAEVLTAAAYLHDVSNYPKDHPDRKLSSEKSMREAERILAAEGFPKEKLPFVSDAILCHSYSRGLEPRTLEGRIFQDADRLDALGAIGVARTFAVGGATGRPLYSARDPFCLGGRLPDDSNNTLDHFYVKLLGLAGTMKTPTGRRLAAERTARIQTFIDQLRDEIGS